MYEDAIREGIRMSKDGMGYNWYYPLCHICGEEVPTWSYISGKEYTCQSCKANMAYMDKEVKDDNAYDLKERKFEEALKRVLKMANKRDLPKYQEASEKVYRKLHTHGWFDSTEEIMVAIELLKSGFKIKHHYKIGGRFIPDFLIPSEKIVLEVDGHIYHTDKTAKKEMLRDDYMRTILGEEWEIVRISDLYINQNIKQLSKAITEVYKKRKAVREQNGGKLPLWYEKKSVL